MSNDSPTDSRDLAQLRVRFRQAYPRLYASPERLGKYARDTSTKISDYGAHSKRWINLFERANLSHHKISTPKVEHWPAPPVEIFNP